MQTSPWEVNEFQPVELERQLNLNQNVSAGAGNASNFLDEENTITDDVAPIPSISSEVRRKLHLVAQGILCSWTPISSEVSSELRRKLRLFQENRRSNGNQQNESRSRSSISSAVRRMFNLFQENTITDDVGQRNVFSWRPIPSISSAVGRMLNLFQGNRRTDDVAQLNESTWKDFISYATGSIRNLSPKQYGFFLLLSGGALSFLTKTCPTRFDSFQAYKTTNTPEPVLTLEGAVDAFYPELMHIAGYMLCWIITFILILPLELAAQIFSGLLWLCSTGIYFVVLVQKTSASKIHVACAHSFKLPLFWFMIILAFGYAFIVGLMLFLFVFLSFIWIHKGNPRPVEVGFNGAMSLL